MKAEALLVQEKAGYAPVEPRCRYFGTCGGCTLQAAGVTCLGVEAGATLLLEREALVASANASGVCLVGLTAV